MIKITFFNRKLFIFILLFQITNIYAGWQELQAESDQRVRERAAQWEAEISDREYNRKRKLEREKQRQNNITLTPEQRQKKVKELFNSLNSKDTKNAIDFVNNAEVDHHEQKQVDPVNRDGFYFDPEPQTPYQYKYSKGGGIDENKLFVPNLGRQKD